MSNHLIGSSTFRVVTGRQNGATDGRRNNGMNILFPRRWSDASIEGPIHDGGPSHE